MYQHIKINSDINLHYYREGKGQPLLFIHGLGGSLNNWTYCYPFFLEKGFEVVGLDLPGYGKSSKPLFPISIADYASILRDFIQGLNLSVPPILIGNSMGGHISSYFAAKYKSRLRALVLIDSSGLNELNLIEEFFVNLAFDKKNIANILRYMIDIFSVNLFHDPTNPNNYSFIEEQKEMAKQSDYPQYCYALENSTKAMLETPLKDILTEIKVPTTIIWGENDRLIPTFYAKKFKNYLPDAPLYFINRCGHIVPLEKPDELNLLILSFLSELNLTVPEQQKKKSLFSLFKK